MDLILSVFIFGAFIATVTAILYAASAKAGESHFEYLTKKINKREKE